MTSRISVRLAEACHPGSFVKSEVIEPHGMSVTEAARALGITRAALSAFLNEHSALSSGMALRQGLWRAHGRVDANAEQLRYSSSPKARKRYQGIFCS